MVIRNNQTGTQNTSSNDPLNSSGDDFSVLSGTDLSSTVGAFSSRFRRKIEKREALDGISEQEQAQRHQRMLNSLVNIRRSLTDVARIDLGNRFSFSLLLDDWGGWPRIRVKLVDSLLPKQDLPQLQVIAHDRHLKGTIEIYHHPAQQPACVSLADQTNIAKLPSVLKRSTRLFLDIVEQAVLNTNDSTYEDTTSLTPESQSGFEETSKNAISDDVFTDYDFENNFLEALPSVDNVSSLASSLPELDNKNLTEKK